MCFKASGEANDEHVDSDGGGDTAWDGWDHSMSMRKLWSKEECCSCGVVGYATRTETRPVEEPYLCEACEIYAKRDQQEIQLREALAGVTSVVSCELGEGGAYCLSHRCRTPCSHATARKLLGWE
jgi:hypothetical protein